MSLNQSFLSLKLVLLWKYNVCCVECSKIIVKANLKISNLFSFFSSFRSSLYERLCRFFVRKGAGGGVAVSSSVVETSTSVNVVTVNGSVKGPNRANPNTVLVKEKKAAMQLGILTIMNSTFR